MKLRAPRFAAFCIALLLSASAPAETQDPGGFWKGAVDVPGTPLAVEVQLEGTGGKWSGKASVPVQNLRDVPLRDVVVTASRAKFTLTGIPGDPTFDGALSEGGKVLSGEFRQGGGTLKFSLTRAESPANESARRLAGFEAVVEKIRTDFKTPGIGLAIVKGDEVVLLKGFGERDREKKLPVTPQTVFAIGSSTKAFTTFVMAQLVAEGRLSWDVPVRTYLPEFELKDRFASERMTPMDLVTHRSGLPRHDLLWYGAGLTRKETVARLRYLEPNEDLRAKFQYNNAMFLTAGYLVEKLTGRTWEENVSERIFHPLGMKTASFSVADVQKGTDFALPYEERDGKVEPIAFREIANVGPAGSINASPGELVAWLRVHLADGKLGAKEILPASALKELHVPRMATGARQTEPEVVPGGYAAGWFTDIYRGFQRVHHGGNIDGFSALVALVPQERIGIVVLVNQDGSPVPGLVARHALDRLLALPARDWAGETLAKVKQSLATQKEAEGKKTLAQKKGTKPAHALSEYAGSYTHPAYGELAITLSGDRRARETGGLSMTYNGITTPLLHWHYETWKGEKLTTAKADTTFADFPIQFHTNMDGDVAAVNGPWEPAVDDIVFKRKPDANLSDPAHLATLAGTYLLGPAKMVFRVVAGKLELEVDGRPQPELLPDRDERFTLKGASGYSVRFTLVKGKATEAVFFQPNGVFTAKRADRE